MNPSAVVGGIAATYVGAAYTGLTISDKRRERRQKKDAAAIPVFNDRRGEK